MAIDDYQLYHGAALLQVAEHSRFSAINRLKYKGAPSRSAFLINHDRALYLKYAHSPTGRYMFTFNAEHLGEIKWLLSRFETRLWFVLVCVDAREICCLSIDELYELMSVRAGAKRAGEAQYHVMVTCEPRKQLRVGVMAPGRRKQPLTELVVPRTRFPDAIFEDG